MAKYLQMSNEIKNLFLLKDSKLVNFTYVKGNNEYSDELLEKIEAIFKDYAPLFFSSVEGICENIFDFIRHLEIFGHTKID